jgi:hypothetical protein
MSVAGPTAWRSLVARVFSNRDMTHVCPKIFQCGSAEVGRSYKQASKLAFRLLVEGNARLSKQSKVGNVEPYTAGRLL